MTSPMSNSKKRSAGTSFAAEEQALDIISKEAESRESKTNAFLSEARKLRSNERERIRKEEELRGEQIEKNGPITSEEISMNSILNDNNDLNEKFSKLLMANGQLDNDKQMLKFQVEHLKDALNDLLEQNVESMRKHKIFEKERDRLRDDVKSLNVKCGQLKNEIRQRDDIIKNNDLTIVSTDWHVLLDEDEVDSAGSKTTTAVLNFECLNALSEYSGSLGEKLLKLFNEKKQTAEENDRLRSQLNGMRSDPVQTPLTGGWDIPSFTPSLPTAENNILDVETQRQLSELKLNLRKAEQEITTLHGTVTRLDTQLNHYKVVAETSERNEEELKAEKRRLQIETRYAQTRIEELESQNGFLLKRIEKIKLTKNVLDNS